MTNMLANLNIFGTDICLPVDMCFRYCAEVLAALPFGLPDEPLYVVYTINRVLQVRGGELEANMKASINDGALGVVAKHVQEIMAAEKEREGDAAYDLNATAQEPESNFNMEMVEDTQGIPDDVLDKLRVRLHLFLSGFFFHMCMIHLVLILKVFYFSYMLLFKSLSD
jgi:hypothetical protein